MKKVIRLSIFAILVSSVLLLVSCAPRSAYAAYQKLAKKEYTVDMDFANKTASKYDPTITVNGTKSYTSGNVDRVYAAYYSNGEAAKLAYQMLKDKIEKQNKEKDQSSDLIVKRSGKWVVYGTKTGVEDFL